LHSRTRRGGPESAESDPGGARGSAYAATFSACTGRFSTASWRIDSEPLGRNTGWRAIHGVTQKQVDARAQTNYQARTEALERMADPARNPNPHERSVAAAKLERLKAKGRAAARPPSAPGLEGHDRQQATFEEMLKRLSEESYRRM
jgi:hypothetical protein